jgi:hypothetical protein
LKVPILVGGVVLAFAWAGLPGVTLGAAMAGMRLEKASAPAVRATKVARWVGFIVV